MDRTQWAAPTTSEEAARRAAGRRAYNYRRQLVAAERRARVMELVIGARLASQGRSLRGLQAVLAERFDVSPATISRDLAHARLRARRSTVCPHCGVRSARG
jgi:hypothetical protein